MRLRMRQRDSGRQHERGDSGPVNLPEITCPDAVLRGLLHAVCVVVPRKDASCKVAQVAARVSRQFALPTSHYSKPLRVGSFTHNVVQNPGLLLNFTPLRGALVVPQIDRFDDDQMI